MSWIALRLFYEYIIMVLNGINLVCIRILILNKTYCSRQFYENFTLKITNINFKTKKVFMFFFMKSFQTHSRKSSNKCNRLLFHVRESAGISTFTNNNYSTKGNYLDIKMINSQRRKYFHNGFWRDSVEQN